MHPDPTGSTKVCLAADVSPLLVSFSTNGLHWAVDTLSPSLASAPSRVSGPGPPNPGGSGKLSLPMLGFPCLFLANIPFDRPGLLTGTAFFNDFFALGGLGPQALPDPIRDLPARDLTCSRAGAWRCELHF